MISGLGKYPGEGNDYPPWENSVEEEPGGLQSIGSQRVGHDRATNTSTFYFFTRQRNHSHLLNLAHDCDMDFFFFFFFCCACGEEEG